MDVKDLQLKVKEVRQKRGFTMDPARIYMLLVEEVGELAGELKRLWSKNYKKFNVNDFEDELADVLILVLGLANQFDVDIEAAILKKIMKDEGRDWVTER